MKRPRLTSVPDVLAFELSRLQADYALGPHCRLHILDASGDMLIIGNALRARFCFTRREAREIIRALATDFKSVATWGELASMLTIAGAILEPVPWRLVPQRSPEI